VITDQNHAQIYPGVSFALVLKTGMKYAPGRVSPGMKLYILTVFS